MPAGVGALFYSECDSTNSVASAMAASETKGPVWIAAGRQTSGRGRKGRVWDSEEGNLYSSFLFAPALQASDMAALPFVVALALRDAFIVAGCAAERVHCKWPNDILINNKKAAGVLIESSAKAGGRLDHIVIGIGANLKFSPTEAIFPATSLYEENGCSLSPKEFLVGLAATLKNRLDSWDLHNFSPIKEEWTRAAWGLGATRTINTALESFDAELMGLDDEGGLIVRLPDGTLKTVVTADIFPART